MINLAGILYAGLTGRWPGVAPSGRTDRAPREGRRPLRPRQVRAGVPRTLDVICERVLHKEASQHAMPIETAHEIAAALADYLGDSGHGRAARHRRACTPSRRSRSTATRCPRRGRPAGEPRPEARARHPEAEAPEATQASPTRPPARPRTRRGRPRTPQIYREPRDDPTTLAPLHAPREEATPPPPFEDPPERPLSPRPSAGSRRRPGRPPAARRPTSTEHAAGHRGTRRRRRGGSTPPPAATSDTGTSGFWPFTDEDEAKNDVHTGKEGRGWLRMAIVVGVLLVLVVAMAIAFNRGRQDGDDPSQRIQQYPGRSPRSASGVPPSRSPA